MKSIGIVCAALLIFASLVASTSAADLAVSKSTLASMGLGSMQLLSDNDGLAIRGMGTSASVWGESTANYRGQTSTNGYAASAHHWHGGSSAHGKNLSFAGTVDVKFGRQCLSVRASLGVAGGFSSASAH